jgi:hypothetical protein
MHSHQQMKVSGRVYRARAGMDLLEQTFLVSGWIRTPTAWSSGRKFSRYTDSTIKNIYNRFETERKLDA